MNVQVVTVEGTLQPDGTLQLDQKPKLSPGRVQVIVQPLPPPAAQRGLVEVMDDVRASQLARGFRRRTLSEMQADEAARLQDDDDYERRYEALWNCSTPQP